VGSTPVNVIGLAELRASIPAGWRRMFELRDLDYADQFTRLPPERRPCAYANCGWQRATDGDAAWAGDEAPTGRSDVRLPAR
jgi:hypothetical protein